MNSYVFSSCWQHNRVVGCNILINRSLRFLFVLLSRRVPSAFRKSLFHALKEALPQPQRALFAVRLDRFCSSVSNILTNRLLQLYCARRVLFIRYFHERTFWGFPAYVSVTPQQFICQTVYNQLQFVERTLFLCVLLTVM